MKEVRDLVSSGTEETICRIVAAYSDMLLRLASTRLGSAVDAEDVVQEVFLYLVEHNLTFRDAGPEKAWLIRTTLHRAANFRKRAEARNLPLEEAASAASEPPGEQRALLDAVRKLPEKYGATIFLYYYEGYTMKEIAKMRGAPSATVGTWLNRGRKILRQMITAEDD